MGLFAHLCILSALVCVSFAVSSSFVFDDMDGANATISQLEAKISKLEKTIANLKVRPSLKLFFFFFSAFFRLPSLFIE